MMSRRAPPQQASYPKTAAADLAESSDLAASAKKGVPDQAALGTAGRPHQPSSSSVGAPPGLGLRQQAGGSGSGVQQACIIDGAMDGQPTQVKLGNVRVLLNVDFHTVSCIRTGRPDIWCREWSIP